MKKILQLFILLFVIVSFNNQTVAQESKPEKFSVGFQRPCWPLWGPSFSYDPGKYFGIETVIGLIRVPDAALKYGAFERVIVRPLHYKNNNLYLFGMFGLAKAEYMGENMYFIEEIAQYFGAYAAAELDLRTLFKKFIPLYVNFEFGIEYSSAGYLHNEPYPSYGFGLRYKF
jgi:hypothetical protein